MDLCTMIKGVSFLLETGLGTLGNFLILLAYAYIVFREHKLSPVDMIFCHLAFANMMVLLTRGVPQTMTVFGLCNLLNDVECKIVIYTYRIVRALSVCITCLLSMFQAITVAPVTSTWASIKMKAPNNIIPSFLALWLINMAVCIAAPFSSKAPRNGTVPEYTLNLGFCHVDFKDQVSYVINGIAVTMRDCIFVILMVVASCYILLLLHRHSQKVKSIRSSDRNQKTTAETRAAKIVIMLVLLYVVFFGIDNIIWIAMLTIAKVSPVIADMRVFFSSCYAALSPFLIISSNKKIKAVLRCNSQQREPRDQATDISYVTT
ncbi:olfactory receptor class A-like protein 1 [Latimeria chalumnae]|uniref:olfactory receptor class A-like protein 1 n=1 Tax=Latimeria chalumnae TaxID=7897 RepID=UPI0003C105F5|nr:PREDICTED: vomeronasal type-1 receptor 4-like [Latimeria chalumnae]|eukprot:XP_005987724.1 PREDICTED: vomeronasal type-1 receptor 4-like [Latimeria chalumnae]